jgi:hypothetical protein
LYDHSQTFGIATVREYFPLYGHTCIAAVILSAHGFLVLGSQQIGVSYSFISSNHAQEDKETEKQLICDSDFNSYTEDEEGSAHDRVCEG